MSDSTSNNFDLMLSLAQPQVSPMATSTLQSGLNWNSQPGLEYLLTVALVNILQQLMTGNVQTRDTSLPSGWPAHGPISQEYHDGHQAYDIAIPTGTPIQSTMSGKVIHAGWNNEGYGNLVIVENGSYRTYYAHLSSIPVAVGDTVEAGSVVGISGSTGNSTGPHLHYEVRLDGQQILPELDTPENSF
jgi:murein DD-endopeptidase MepM/ murein hydrolase activator NlpD